MNKPVETLSLLPLWIGGGKVASQSARFGEVTNPATGKVIRRVPFANSADIDAAVAAAKQAFPAWSETSPLKRARIMRRYLQLLEKNREQLARLASEEHGKTLSDAVGSVQRGIEVAVYAFAEGRTCGKRGSRRGLLFAQAAGGRVRGDHAIQLPGDGAVVDVPAGDRLRQHRCLIMSRRK